MDACYPRAYIIKNFKGRNVVFCSEMSETRDQTNNKKTNPRIINWIIHRHWILARLLMDSSPIIKISAAAKTLGHWILIDRLITFHISHKYITEQDWINWRSEITNLT